MHFLQFYLYARYFSPPRSFRYYLPFTNDMMLTVVSVSFTAVGATSLDLKSYGNLTEPPEVRPSLRTARGQTEMTENEMTEAEMTEMTQPTINRARYLYLSLIHIW